MSFGKEISMRRRVLSATWAFIANFVLWIVIPYYIGTLLVGRVPESALTVPSFVYEFGALFIMLEVGAAFFRGKGISVPFLSAVAVLAAVYLWLITNGGNLSVTAAGIDITLGFQTMVYVLLLPEIWAAIRAPLSYLVWRRSLRGEYVVPPPPPPAKT